MNYFAHGLRFVDRPWFLAGTAAPDWLSALDRGVRLRTKSATPIVEHEDPRVAEFARGVLQHLSDDDWFHSTRGFAEVTDQLAVQFRTQLGPDSPIPCGFLGHIVTEMLLDAELIRRQPQTLVRYYEALSTIDAEMAQVAVNCCAARGRTERLVEFLPLFLSERFLDDYPDPSRLMRRLNQVLRRVQLTPIAEATVCVLEAGQGLIVDRFEDLLPPEHFGGPS